VNAHSLNFTSNAADARACATSGADKSMTKPEEQADGPMHTGFAGDVDAEA